ncbi:MAG: leucine-rich repeat protein [Clostridia bacterium]|nr:leucine-rich repeat protein [Clostridia bacterium]
MKLLEKLKKIPKEKLIIGITLTVLLITTVVIIVVCAIVPSDKDLPDDTETSDDELVVGVWDEVTDTTDTTDTASTSTATSETFSETTKVETTVETESETTEAPKPPTDANGLEFRSNGDGTCSVIGIGTCEAVELKIPAKSPQGESVTSISDRAFEDCYEIMTISIPASVKTIGTGAFRGCGGLSFINVDALNPSFCSSEGVLYSKDKSVLVCYPQSRSGSRYILPTSVRTISAYAFENVLNLTGILYEGSIVKFQSIDVLAGNEKFSSLSITCNYSGK